jgi:hypothetical protein
VINVSCPSWNETRNAYGNKNFGFEILMDLKKLLVCGRIILRRIFYKYNDSVLLFVLSVEMSGGKIV